MPRSLDEIAADVEQVADSLEVMAAAFAPSGDADKAKAEIRGSDGKPIDLRELAREIRTHLTGV